MLQMFCCSLCKYSSATKAHLAIHACFSHDAKPVPWYERSGYGAQNALSVQEFKNFVQEKYYVCALATNCQFRCLNNEVFHRHLLETHKSYSVYTCHLCLWTAKTFDDLVHHYQNYHEFFTVHCVYCDFGSDDYWIVMHHIMGQHARSPFRILLRNGDSPAVFQVLQRLIQEVLTRDPVMPPQLPSGLSLEITHGNVSSTEEEVVLQSSSSISSHKSLTTRGSLDQTCKGQTAHSLGMPLEEMLFEDHIASSDACITSQNPNRMSPLSTAQTQWPFLNECMQHFAITPEETGSRQSSSHYVQRQTPEQSRAELLPETETGSTSLADGWHLACNIENCATEFGDIFDFLNHLTECHPLQPTFSCPRCSLVFPSGNISAHFVEKHSGFLFCPYPDGSFGSGDQHGLDYHIFQAHQICEEENNKNSAVVAGEGGLCTASTSSSNYTSTGSGDFTSEMEICNGEGRNDHFQSEVNDFLFCPYPDYSFGSRDQWGLDNSVIQAHQTYEENNRSGAVVGRKSGPCTTSTSFDNYTSTWSEDCTSEMKICNGEGRNDHFHYEANLEDTKDDLTVQLYFCRMCSTHCSTLCHFLCHMASEHSVPFICGHCFKPYKMSRCLLMHVGSLHLGQPFSVFCLEGGKVIDIGLRVAPLWIEEAQQYLRAANRRKMRARGKGMLKNLRRAIRYITSSCLTSVAPQAELPLSNTVTQCVSKDPRWSCANYGLSLANDRTIDIGHQVEKVSGGPLFLSNQSCESAPAATIRSKSLMESSSQSIKLYHDFSNFITSFVETSPPQSQDGSLSNPQPNTVREHRLKILGAVYINADSFKKVDGRIVVNNEVLQTIQSLDTVHLPTESSALTRASGPPDIKVNEGLHACTQCFTRFSTYYALARHILQRHSLDFITGVDVASAVLSIGQDSDLQGSAPKRGHIEEQRAISWRFEQKHLKDQKCLDENSELFVWIQSKGVKVPYSQISKQIDLQPVVRLRRL